jgi:hypothetical protein
MRIEDKVSLGKSQDIMSKIAREKRKKSWRYRGMDQAIEH